MVGRRPGRSPKRVALNTGVATRRYAAPGVAEFLSEAWIVELDRAARDASALGGIGAPEPLVVEQRVQRSDVVVVYHFSFTPDGARVSIGPAAAPDLVLVADEDTARSLQQGSLRAQDATVSRRLKVRGQIQRLRGAGEALRSLDDVWRTVRDATTYPAESGSSERRRSRFADPSAGGLPRRTTR